ncbi:hypothetical protein CTRI78_v007594 [Colletotrichum trifolii]|uniref:F-box domain-containing protein n=1 Tax=Colletotrichum trifolii TaxID=5466 RepID=A0A4R8R8F4_COLTR|nr:hypothetical protein CTRI78_v007594 [Colletotrichum trifolii]
MASFNDLPVEMVEHIVDYLAPLSAYTAEDVMRLSSCKDEIETILVSQRRDLANLALTCKGTYIAFKWVLDGFAIVTGSNAYSQLFRLRTMVRRNGDQAKLIRHLFCNLKLTGPSARGESFHERMMARYSKARRLHSNRDESIPDWCPRMIPWSVMAESDRLGHMVGQILFQLPNIKHLSVQLCTNTHARHIPLNTKGNFCLETVAVREEPLPKPYKVAITPVQRQERASTPTTALPNLQLAGFTPSSFYWNGAPYFTVTPQSAANITRIVLDDFQWIGNSFLALIVSCSQLETFICVGKPLSGNAPGPRTGGGGNDELVFEEYEHQILAQALARHASSLKTLCLVFCGPWGKCVPLFNLGNFAVLENLCIDAKGIWNGSTEYWNIVKRRDPGYVKFHHTFGEIPTTLDIISNGEMELSEPPPAEQLGFNSLPRSLRRVHFAGLTSCVTVAIAYWLQKRVVTGEYPKLEELFFADPRREPQLAGKIRGRGIKLEMGVKMDATQW